MNTKLYTKSSPKIQDYNPLTHTSFYDKNPIFLTPSLPPSLDVSSSMLLKSPEKPKMLRAQSKNIFSTSGYSMMKSSSQLFNKPNYAKTRLRNTVMNPISGEIKVFNIDRPRISSLDFTMWKEKFTDKEH